jgi:SNF family Na+-dependent transporter
MAMVVNQSMVVGWFTKIRAFALSVTAAGITLGIAVLTPLSNFLISRYGWRISNALIGIAAIAIILPLAWFFANGLDLRH